MKMLYFISIVTYSFFLNASLNLFCWLLSELFPTLTEIRPYDVAHHTVLSYPFEQIYTYRLFLEMEFIFVDTVKTF